MPRTSVLMVAILGLMAACAPAPTGEATTTTQPTTTTTTTTTGPTTTSTTTITEEEAVAVVYLFMNGAGGPHLVPVAREIEPTEAVGRAALEMLLAGPTQDEGAGIPALSSAVPEGTELLGLVVSDGLATVDLSSAFESGGGSFSVLGRLAQVVYTLTRFPTVDRVTFLVAGEPVEVFSGEGVILEEPQVRDDYLDFLPSIFVDRPVWGGDADQPLRLTGLAEVEEFTVTVTDREGLILVEETVRAGGSEGTFVPFDVTIPYQVDQDQRGAVIVATPDRQDVREYPVRLSGR